MLEYNIATKIAELIKKFDEDYDYIELSFASKDCKSHKKQNIFFLGKEGQILNGKKITP